MNNYYLTYPEYACYIDDINDLYMLTKDSKTLLYSHVKSIIDISFDEAKFVIHFIDLTVILYEDPNYESYRFSTPNFYNFMYSIVTAKQFISFSDIFTAYITEDNKMIMYEEYDYIKVKTGVESAMFVIYPQALFTYLLDGSLVVQYYNKKYKTVKIENPKKTCMSTTETYI